METKILDSGNRREFETGAVRDIQEGKGRCDLAPLDIIGMFMGDNILINLSMFQYSGDPHYLVNILRDCPVQFDFESYPNMFLEVSKHFEDGCNKYGEDNWRKGIPTKCYVDSAARHYFKYLRGDDDERHDRAFVWNILCAIWTCEHMPDQNSYLKPKPEETVEH